jgi:hypothetical protein
MGTRPILGRYCHSTIKLDLKCCFVNLLRSFEIITFPNHNDTESSKGNIKSSCTVLECLGFQFDV